MIAAPHRILQLEILHSATAPATEETKTLRRSTTEYELLSDEVLY